MKTMDVENLRDLIETKIKDGEYPVSLKAIQREFKCKLLPVKQEILDFIKSMGLKIK